MEHKPGYRCQSVVLMLIQFYYYVTSVTPERNWKVLINFSFFQETKKQFLN